MLLDWLVGARAVPWEPGREVGQGIHRPAPAQQPPRFQDRPLKSPGKRPLEARAGRLWADGSQRPKAPCRASTHLETEGALRGHAPFTVSAFSRVWQQNRKGSVALNCVHTENRVNKITGTRRSEPFRGPDRRQVSGIQAVTKPWRVIHIPHRLHILCQVSPCPR